MQRRDFIKALGVGCTAGALPCLAADQGNAGDPSWAEAFAKATGQHPWLAGYRTAAADSFNAQAVITGKWPAELQGTLYRNGPAGHEVEGFRYHHWFDGDGMLQAFKMGPGGASHQAKMIQTRKYQAEKTAARALYPTFATLPPDPRSVTSPDQINPGNISVLPHHGKLLALWEAGSPWEMDPDTLETRGIYSFSDDSLGVPFSAHPRVEPDGTLWNFGYLSAAKMIVLWHIDGRGQVVKMGKLSCDPISMPHDFIVTSRHIVLMMPPMNFEPDGHSSFLDAHVWHEQQPTRLLVVDKNDFSSFRWLELPSQWVFHFGNGWEDAAGVIRFDAARADNPMAMVSTFRDVMRGKITPPEGARHYQYRIDTRSWTASETPLLDESIHSEFPVVDPRVSCRRYRRVIMLSRDQQDPAIHMDLNAVSSLDLDSGKWLSWRYPDTQIPEEHLFIPRENSELEGPGWVLGSSYDWQKNATQLNVFDAQTLDAGPVAIAQLPYALPLGLHGKFVND